MARFVSRCPNLCIPLINEEKQLIPTQTGVFVRQTVVEQFDIYFQQFKWRSQAELDFALDYFFPIVGASRQSGDRAMPMLTPGVFSGTSTMYEPHDPRTMLSLFDTLDPEMCPPQYAEQALAKLRLHEGTNFIEYLEQLPQAPWPTYDEIKGNQSAGQIAKIVDELGLDARAVIAYEQTRSAHEGPRPSVLEKLEEIQVARDKARVDEENLVVTV